MAKVPVHCHHCFTVRLPAGAYPTTADASNLLPVFPESFAEADHHMGRRRQSNRKHHSRDQSMKWGREMSERKITQLFGLILGVLFACTLVLNVFAF
jgi:hypothetical protein